MGGLTKPLPLLEVHPLPAVLSPVFSSSSNKEVSAGPRLLPNTIVNKAGLAAPPHVPTSDRPRPAPRDQPTAPCRERTYTYLPLDFSPGGRCT